MRYDDDRVERADWGAFKYEQLQGLGRVEKWLQEVVRDRGGGVGIKAEISGGLWLGSGQSRRLDVTPRLARVTGAFSLSTQQDPPSSLSRGLSSSSLVVVVLGVGTLCSSTVDLGRLFPDLLVAVVVYNQ